MKRLLRVLGALALVPLVVFANPTHAAAANPWHTVTIQPSLPGINDGMECSINLQYATDLKTMALGGKSFCSGSMDITPGQAQWGEDGSRWFLGVYGTDTLGPCGGNAEGTFGEHSSSGIVNVAGTFSAETIAFAATAGCDLDEVCLTLFPEPVGLNNSETCVPVDIDAPEASQGACEYGVPSHTTAEVVSRLNAAQTAYEWWWEVTVTFADRPDGTWAQWRLTGDPAKQVGVTTGSGLLFKQTQRSTIYPPGDSRFLALAEEYRPKQLQVYALDARWNTPDLSGEWDPSSSVLAQQWPPAMPDGGYRGLTQPDYCRFYFGQKVVDFPNTDADEPVGPVIEGDPPPGEDVPVDEPDADPITVEEPGPDTETGFWSAILSLLKGLARAIGGIAGAILDGLMGLFVPDLGVIKAEIEGAQDAWADTAPGKILGTFSAFADDLTAPSNSGCEGVELRLDAWKVGTAGAGPGEVVLHPLSTCGPGLSTFANVTRVGISLLVAVGAMVAGFRILSGAFGINATPGAAS